MSPKRTRRVWTDEEKLRAIAHARQFGPAAAAREFAIPVGTVKSWLARSGDDAGAVEVAAGDLLEREQRTGALDDGELGALHREAATAMAAALKRGDTLGAQRLATPLGVLEDKVTRRQEAPRSERADSLDVRESLARRDELDARYALILEAVHVRRVHGFATADVDTLRQFRELIDERISTLYQARRMLVEEQLRRRRGAPSLFAGVKAFADVPDVFPLEFAPGLPRRLDTWAPVLPPVPLPADPRSSDLGGPTTDPERIADDLRLREMLNDRAEDVLRRREVEERQRPPVEVDESVVVPIQPTRWRRAHSGWAGPRRGVDARIDHRPNGAA